MISHLMNYAANLSVFLLSLHQLYYNAFLSSISD